MKLSSRQRSALTLLYDQESKRLIRNAEWAAKLPKNSPQFNWSSHAIHRNQVAALGKVLGFQKIRLARRNQKEVAA